MDQDEIIKLVKQYADRIQSIVTPDEIRLYGSWAKGTATESSDIDVAVFVDDEPDDFLTMESALWNQTREVDLRIEPVLVINKEDPSGFRDMVFNTGIRIEI